MATLADIRRAALALPGAEELDSHGGAWFNVGKKTIRLIDTPGIADCRGADQDVLNFSSILQYIAHIPEIHGICILLKPNNSRMNIVFKYCINELLTHLHVSAAENIAFCFTNARGTFYR